MASSKLFADVALISLTLATDISTSLARQRADVQRVSENDYGQSRRMRRRVGNMIELPRTPAVTQRRRKASTASVSQLKRFRPAVGQHCVLQSHKAASNSSSGLTNLRTERRRLERDSSRR